MPKRIALLNGDTLACYDNQFAVMMEYVDGQDGRKDLNTDKFRNLGISIAKLHKASKDFSTNKKRIDKHTNVFEKLSKKIKVNDGKLYSEYKELYSQYTKYEDKISNESKHFVHGDLIFANILFDNNDVLGIIDFDDMTKDLFVKELAGFIMGVYDHHGLYKPETEYVEVLVSEYNKISPLSDFEKEVFPLYLKQSQLAGWRLTKKYRPEKLEDFIFETSTAIDAISKLIRII